MFIVVYVIVCGKGILLIVNLRLYGAYGYFWKRIFGYLLSCDIKEVLMGILENNVVQLIEGLFDTVC